MKLNINGNLVEVSDEDLSKALEDKQESFEVKTDDLVIRTNEQQETYEANLKKEVGDHKVEIGRKEVLSGLGIEIEGLGLHKTLDKSLEAINGFIGDKTTTALSEAGKAPDGKIKELTTDLETLRSNLALKDGEIETAKGELVSFMNNASINSGLSKVLGGFNDINSPEDQALIFKSKQRVILDENNIIRGVNADGSIMKDSNLNPLGLDQVVSKYYDNNPNSLVKATGGAGGGDSTGKDGKLDWDGFVKNQKEAGNNPSSEKFNTAKEKLITSGVLVM